MDDRTWRVWLSAYAPVLLWVTVIFYLSSGSGSSAETSRIIRPLLEFFFPNSPEATLELYHRAIRKVAHLAEYALLSLLLARAFLLTWPAFRYWPWAAVGLVGLVAAVDEVNQSVDASRTASPYDSLLDIIGGAVAVFVLWLFMKRRAAQRRPLAEQAQG